MRVCMNTCVHILMHVYGPLVCLSFDCDSIMIMDGILMDNTTLFITATNRRQGNQDT